MVLKGIGRLSTLAKKIKNKRWEIFLKKNFKLKNYKRLASPLKLIDVFKITHRVFTEHEFSCVYLGKGTDPNIIKVLVLKYFYSRHNPRLGHIIFIYI